MSIWCLKSISALWGGDSELLFTMLPNITIFVPLCLTFDTIRFIKMLNPLYKRLPTLGIDLFIVMWISDESHIRIRKKDY